MSKILLGLPFVLASGSAWATAVPSPEIGGGIPTLALVGGAALIVGAAVFLKRLRQ
jgi:hypothetical protein